MIAPIGFDETEEQYIARLEAAIARQAASQGSAGGGREAIARIIEPNGFHLLDELAKPESDGFPNRSEAENLASRQADLAYTKADAILALPKLTAAETSLQNPQTSPERPDHAQASLARYLTKWQKLALKRWSCLAENIASGAWICPAVSKRLAHVLRRR